MEFHQALSSFSSLQQLLEELETLIALESDRSGNPWVSVARLSRLLYKKYRVSLEEVAKTQDYGDSLRTLFRSSKRFSIYGTQNPQNFYVALFQAVIPDSSESQATSIKHINRTRRLDRNLPRILKAKGTEAIQPRSSQRVSQSQPILAPKIKSADALEIALIEIIKSSIANYPEEFVTISQLSRNFYNCYRQTVRTVVRSVYPDLKLIELLQTIPCLHVQKVDYDWQITLQLI